MSRTRRDDIAELARTRPTAALQQGLAVSREALADAVPGSYEEGFDLDCVVAISQELDLRRRADHAR